MQNEDIDTCQETAGFHDLELRHAIGALFNHLFFFSTLKNREEIKSAEPTGAVSNLKMPLLMELRIN